MRLFSQIGWYFRQEWHRYLGAVLLLIMIAILQLLPPKLVGIIVDGVATKKISIRILIVWIVIILSSAIIVYLLRYLWRVLLFGASYKLAIELRDNFYHHLSQQNPAFYLRHRTGDLMARATNDVDQVVFAAGEGVLTLVDSLVMGILVIVVMSTQINWQLTLLSLIPMPLMAVAIKYCGSQLHQRFTSAQAAFSKLNDQAQESMTSIRMIKAFGLEDYQSKRFAEVAVQTGKENMHAARVNAYFNPTIYLAIGASNLLAISGGSWMVVNATLTLGQLTSFMMYLGLMIWPMLALAWMFNIVERGSAAYGRICTLLAEVPTVQDGTLSLPASRGILIADIKEFHYPESKVLALNNFILRLEPGQMLGLCGPTGAGKSTLLSLIQRKFDIDSGQISYHGLPLREVKLDDWRSRLSVVSQTSFLFSDNVANNISLGHPEATQKQIEQAAQLANVHEDILRLPQGYQTEVGERGIMLSGGQKQRIAIARALLLDTEILIFDDALSSVDAHTENKILNNLHHLRLRKDQTVIISAHRLSALTEASEILVMRQGHVIQRGEHVELVTQPGWYRDMYRYQQLEAALHEVSKCNEALLGNE